MRANYPLDTVQALTLKEVCARTKLSPSTIRRKDQKGIGPPQLPRQTRGIRYDAHGLEDWMMYGPNKSTVDAWYTTLSDDQKTGVWMLVSLVATMSKHYASGALPLTPSMLHCLFHELDRSQLSAPQVPVLLKGKSA